MRQQATGARAHFAAAFGSRAVTKPACTARPPLLCSVTVAWAGDCRAVAGLRVPTAQGPRCLALPLTQDHKPGRWAGTAWRGLQWAAGPRPGAQRAAPVPPRPHSLLAATRTQLDCRAQCRLPPPASPPSQSAGARPHQRQRARAGGAAGAGAAAPHHRQRLFPHPKLPLPQPRLRGRL